MKDDTGRQLTQVGKKKKVACFVRLKPTSNFADDMIELCSDDKTINIHTNRSGRGVAGAVNNQMTDWSFKLDGILNNATQEQVYDSVAENLVHQVMEGYNGTILAYGQTGAGKTFTMTGATESYRHRGLIPRSIAQVYRELEERQEQAITVRVSYLEIYNETMFDLLSTLPDVTGGNVGASPDGNLNIIEDESGNISVKGLRCLIAQNEEEALNLLFEGETNRAIAMHSLNKASSRSHCIFTLHVESRSRVQSDAKYTVSKLNLVDLAGSERLGKTQSEGKTQTEAMYINKSLTFLEQTIIALADKRREHVPHRQSKLTHFLKDSIGGNCNTLMVAAIWSEANHIEETIGTLRFATRMMCVAIEPALNEHFDPTIQVKKMEKELRSLKQELAMYDMLTSRTNVNYEPLAQQQLFEIKNQVRRYLDGQIDEIELKNVRQIQAVFSAFKDVVGKMEAETEERLKEKYVMVPRGDEETNMGETAGSQSKLSGSTSRVGEPDGPGFNVGQAPPGSKGPPFGRSKVVGKSKSKPSHRPASPVASGEDAKPWRKAGGGSQMTTGVGAAASTQAAAADGVDGGLDGGPTSPTGDPSAVSLPPAPLEKPSTPPPRDVAFEEFKKERGSEINRILIENKDILTGKKKSYAEEARNVNNLKAQIDAIRTKIEDKERTRQDYGELLTEDGEPVIDEEEFSLIKELKELKTKYRSGFDEVKAIKSEVQYCQKLVDQCRERLITEFDVWYADCYLFPATGYPHTIRGGEGGSDINVTYNNYQDFDDKQEKFDQSQQAFLLNFPDSASFYNAKIQSDRRGINGDVGGGGGGGVGGGFYGGSESRRSPGEPFAVNKNKPPNALTQV